MTTERRAVARTRLAGALGAVAGLTAITGLGAVATAAVGGTSALASVPSGNCHPVVKPCALPAASARYTPPKRTVRRPALPIQEVADRSVVGALASPAARQGYRIVGSSGGVYGFGTDAGRTRGVPKLAAPIVATAATPDGLGYWEFAADGGVFARGDARFYGSLASHHLSAPVVGAAATPDGRGYWVVARDGGVFAFGDAPYEGGLAAHRLAAPAVGIAGAPNGHGYWVVARDGGVFSFGHAPYRGGLAAHALAAPAVGIAAALNGRGYWVVARDGGVFAFGYAPYHGSMSGHRLSAPIVALAARPDGRGYWEFGADGGVFAFGDAAYLGAGKTAAPRPHPSPSRTRPAAAHTASGASGGRGPAYPPGSTGMDISRYQCGRIPANRPTIAIVQVSGGQLNGIPNPCFAPEAAWAGPQLQTYIYLDGLPSPVPVEARTGLAGRCDPHDRGCLSFNFGFAWAAHWVAYAGRFGYHPNVWWIDVEANSGWTDKRSNQGVIVGAVTAIRVLGARVGIYSTSYQWSHITGGMRLPGTALWIPGAGALTGPGYTATNMCSWAPPFAGGTRQLIQYGYTGPFAGAYHGPGGYDLDYACR